MTKSKTEIQEIILQRLSELTRLPSGRIRLSDRVVEDLRVDGDDLSFLFVPGVERAVGAWAPVEAWREVFTVGDIIDLVYSAYLTEPAPKGRVPSIAGRFSSGRKNTSTNVDKLFRRNPHK
jgi:hypothetical protein